MGSLLALLPALAGMALGQWVRLRVQPELFKKIFFSGLLAARQLPCSTLGAVTSPEPRFAKIAAMIGDPTRARMLAALMGGELHRGRRAGAGRGCHAADRQHAHRQAGRQRAGGGAQPGPAPLLPPRRCRHRPCARSLVAGGRAQCERRQVGARRLQAAQGRAHLLRPPRRRAGRAVCSKGLLACGTLAPHDGHFAITETGSEQLKALGLDQPSTTARRFAYPCLDWSERRDHLAGSLAVAMLEQGLSKGLAAARQGLARPDAHAFRPAGLGAMARSEIHPVGGLKRRRRLGVA